ncbi:hypothetical protein HYS72_00400 [Candidatus Pacearchaeota archaeon]|nr:hypothetical protein [Candidatus Pacearchaeota archaeon]
MKNKFILGLILGIFLVGLVSAGITGYVIRGQSLSSDGVTATLQSVDRFGTATVVVKTPTGTESVQITEGRTATTSEGTTITASNLRTGSLFSRAGGNLQIARGPQFAGIATGTGNQTNQTGNTSCMMCTKKYQVLEGEAIVVDGNTFSINYMDSDSSVLSVNQGLTSDLLVGQTFIVNGQIVTLTEINPPVGLGVGNVQFCQSSSY